MVKVLELFGGIGAPRKALENLGVNYEVVDYVEIDPYAVKSYNTLYGENYDPQDITEWDKDLDVDIVFHGSPCVNFSMIGDQSGGKQGSGTQSSLMWHTVRIVEKLRPKVVIWENVKGVLNKNHIDTFNEYLKTMNELGYTNSYELLNSNDFGIPQARERVFVVSILGSEFTFNIVPKHNELRDFLEDEVDVKYHVPKRIIQSFYDKKGAFGKRFVLKDRSKPAFTLIAKSGRAAITNNYVTVDENITTEYVRGKEVLKEILDEDIQLRALTPKEYWRLIGFTDEDFGKVDGVISDAQLYKQAGNSIVVQVLESILLELLDTRKLL